MQAELSRRLDTGCEQYRSRAVKPDKAERTEAIVDSGRGCQVFVLRRERMKMRGTGGLREDQYRRRQRGQSAVNTLVSLIGL